MFFFIFFKIEIKDRQTQEKDAVRQGVKFYVDYIGSTLVQELDEGLSYGDKISAKAVRAIHDMVWSCFYLLSFNLCEIHMFLEAHFVFRDLKLTRYLFINFFCLLWVGLLTVLKPIK